MGTAYYSEVLTLLVDVLVTGNRRWQAVILIETPLVPNVGFKYKMEGAYRARTQRELNFEQES